MSCQKYAELLLVLQMFKVLYAGRRFQAGNSAEALKYAEAIGRALLASPSEDRRLLSNLLKVSGALILSPVNVVIKMDSPIENFLIVVVYFM